MTFLRIRQRRNCANFCFFSVFILWRHGFGRGVKLIIIEPSCLPCVGSCSRIAGPCCLCKVPADRNRGFHDDLAHNLFVRTFDRQVGVFLDGYFDLVGNVVIDGVRITQREVDDLAHAAAALKPTPWISSFFTNPSATPLTMLLTSARLKPCKALDSASSPFRRQPCRPRQRGWSARQFPVELPLEPSTSTFCPFLPLTLAGMAIGCFQFGT